jgi:hypothetical protein
MSRNPASEAVVSHQCWRGAGLNFDKTLRFHLGLHRRPALMGPCPWLADDLEMEDLLWGMSVLEYLAMTRMWRNITLSFV